MYALILAGGTGTRLWPQSRTARPKQLLPLIGSRTMMQATVNRVRPITPVEQIFVATNREYGPIIKEQIPDLPAQNIIEEPSGKNTAPGIGLASLHMPPDEVMASLHADHFIANEEGFRQALLAAEKVARQGYLVTLGIKPDKPETGYGYVQRAEELGVYNQHPVFRAARFLEKPDLATAEKFVASGEYYWNSGIFIWQISTLHRAFRAYMPEFAGQLDRLDQARKTGQPIEPIWQHIESCSIDVGVMERADKVAVVPVDFGWNDVGSWAAIHELNADQADQAGNIFLNTEHVAVDCRGVLVEGNGRFVATVGLEEVIIVDSGDALLVCAKDKAQDVKKIVTWLEQHHRTDLL